MQEENEKSCEGAPVEEQAQKYGKFDSVEALQHAYEALEAEFTRRSQRLKMLEAQNKQTEEAKAQTEVAFAPQSTESAQTEKEAEPNAQTLLPPRTVPLMAGEGVGIAAPVRKPKSIAEAGKLALGYLKKKN